MAQEKFTVLLVDDTEDTRHFIREALLLQGDPKILEASNPSEAKDLLEQEIVDAVVMDIEYPGGVSAYPFFKHITSGKGEGQVNTNVFVSAYSADVTTKNAALEAGADEFHTAPFDSPQVFEELSLRVQAKRAEEKR